MKKSALQPANLTCGKSIRLFLAITSVYKRAGKHVK